LLEIARLTRGAHGGSLRLSALEARVVNREDRVGKERQRLRRRFAPGQFFPQHRETRRRRQTDDLVVYDQRPDGLRTGSGTWCGQRGKGDVLQCAVGDDQQAFRA
jgi:hypothetical protein